MGWSTSKEEYVPVDFDVMPESDVDLYAFYQKVKYTITFNANINLPDGTTTTKEYEYHERLGEFVPSDLQEIIDAQTEYVFVGWFLDSEFKEEFVEVSMPAEDIVLYAKWQFSGIRFMNGLEVFYEVKDDEGASVQAPLQNPTKPGYDFVGWVDAKGNVVSFPLIVTDEVQFIYAAFEAKNNMTYKVEHYLENLNGTFVRQEVEELFGSTDSEVEALWKSYTGFSKDETNKNNVLKGIVNYNGTLVLKLYYSRNSYKVSFETNGGSAIQAVSYKYEQMVAAPSSPNKLGYTFAGWELNGESYSFTNMPAHDIELSAKWQVVEYTVTFVAAELVGKVTYTVENKNIIEPAVPAVEHFTGAWEEYELTTGNITVKAVYTPVTYTVTFKAEGATVDTENYTVVNPTINEPSVPTKEHYTGAWESYVLVGGNVEVEAVYTPVTYYVTFVAEGTEVAKLPYTVENKAVVNPAVPAKAHYTGVWESYTLTSGNVEVEAIYTPVTYYVTFVAEGTEVAKLPYTVENKAVVNPAVPAKAHYTGVWESYTLTSGNVEVEAVYTPVTYYVTFVAEGTEVAKLPYTVENKAVVNPAVPAKAHYTGVWESYTLTSGNVEVEAIYTPVTYTVTFKDGDSVIGSDTYTIVDTIITEPALPTKAHYTSAWAAFVLDGGNKEVQVVYTPVTYYVTFVAEGTEVAKLPYTVENTAIVEPAVPAKTGYTAAWESYSVVNGNITVNAVYTAITYYVTFVADGVEVAKLPYTIVNNIVVEPEVPTKAGYNGSWNTYELNGGNKEVQASYEIIDYSINYNTNDGALIMDAIIADFLNDYNEARGKSHTVESFVALGSMSQISDASLFLYNAQYKAKWSWLVNYIASVASAANKPAYDVFFDFNSQSELNAANSNHIYRIAYELRGWVGQTQYTQNANFKTADYSTRSVQLKAFEYYYSNSYNIESETINLYNLYKPGHTFEGWYNNPEFTGSAITSIPSGSYGDINLYAKFVELPKYQLNMNLNEGKLDDSYYGVYSIDDPQASLDISTYDNTGNASGTYFCDTSIVSDNSLRWQYKILLQYDDSLDAYKVVCLDAAKASANNAASAAGVTWTHALSSSTSNITTLVTLGQYIVLSQKVTVGNNDFEAFVYEEPQLIYGVKPIIYTIESEDITLPTPTKDGYTFAGWYNNPEFTGEKVTVVDTAINSNVTVYAKWLAGSYIITFNTDGGSAVPEQTVEYLNVVEKPTNPTKPGYVFVKWQLNGIDYDFDTKVTTSIELVAVWEETIYNVTYDFNGGEVPATYEFAVDNYNTGSNGLYSVITTVDYAAGTISNRYWERVLIKFDESLGLWVTVGVAPYGGSTNAIENTYGATHALVTHSGATNKETRTKIVEIYNGVTEGKTYYLDLGDFTSSNVPSQSKTGWNQLAKVYTNIDLVKNNILVYNKDPESLPTAVKPYYEFIGWYSDVELTNKVESIERGSEHASFTLYAKYELIQYTISYDLVDNNAVVQDLIYSYTVESDTFILPEPVLDGYVFNGWFDEEQNKIIQIVKGSYGDIKLTAQWIADVAEEFVISDADAEALSAIYTDKSKVATILVDLSKNSAGKYALSNNKLNAAYDEIEYIYGINLFSSISEALEAAKENDIIYVFKGTYTEALTITSANITLAGPNYNIPGTETRAEEAIISKNITPNADGFTINGIKFTGTQIKPTKAISNLSILNIISTGAGALVQSSGGRQGVVGSIYDINGLVVKYSSFTLTGAAGKNIFAIYGALTNADIQYNTFDNGGTSHTNSEVGRFNDVRGTFTYSNNISTWATANYTLFVRPLMSVDATIVVSDNIFNGGTGIGSGFYFPNQTANSSVTFIGNELYNIGGNIFSFADCQTGSKQNIMFNYFDSNTAYKLSTKGSGTITYLDNYYAASQTTSTSDYGVMQSYEEMREAYRIWLLPSESLTLNANGGTLSSNPTSYKVGLEVDLPTPTKEHYTFGGWYTNPEFTGEAMYKILESTSGVLNLYAKWTPVEYTVTFKSEVAEDIVKTYTVDNTTIEEPTVPTKVGYTGVWESYTLTSGNVEVNAVYTINQYKVTFMNGGDVLSEETLDYGTTINAIADPTKDGYEFVGWSIDLPTTVPASDLVIEAQWEKLLLEKDIEYLLCVEQVTLGKKLYVTGEVSNGRYLATTIDDTVAAKIFGEKVTGGYKFYILDGSTKKYLDTYLNSDSDISLQFTAESNSIYVYHEDIKAWVTNVEGTDYYFGTYSSFATLIASKTSYINADNTGVSQFPGFFVKYDDVEHHTHTFNAGRCECGIIDPNYVIPDSNSNTADLDTMETNSSYVESKSINGWVAKNSAVLNNQAFIGNNVAVVINGKTSAIGTLTSPTLTGGIAKLTFNYGLPFTDTKIDFDIIITDLTTSAKYEYNVSNLSATKQVVYEETIILETVIKGNFSIEFINNSPSNSGSNKDRTALWNIKWYSDASQHEHEFINGECNCGELHDCVFNEGVCECGAEDPNYVPPVSESTWQLVTDINELHENDQIVIVANSYNYALSTNQKTNNRGQASVTKTDNTITFGDDVQIITLKAGANSGTFAFYTGSGYLYAASSSSNHLKTQTTLDSNGSWQITITSTGVATIKAQGSNTRNWLRYNTSSSLFACYSSGQGDVCIYKLTN